MAHPIHSTNEIESPSECRYDGQNLNVRLSLFVPPARRIMIASGVEKLATAEM